MDPLVELLITKYRLPPDQAKSFAASFLLGTAPQDAAMRGEAAAMRAQRANQIAAAGFQQALQLRAAAEMDPHQTIMRRNREIMDARYAREAAMDAHYLEQPPEGISAEGRPVATTYGPNGATVGIENRPGHPRYTPLRTYTPEEVRAENDAMDMSGRQLPRTYGPPDEMPEVRRAYRDYAERVSK